MNSIELIYQEMDRQGGDKDVHLAIEAVSKKTCISEKELLIVYDLPREIN